MKTSAMVAQMILIASLAHTVARGNPSSEGPSPQATLEQSITEQLQERLDGLLPQERYKLIVNVRSSEERVKVLLEGETQSQSDGKEEIPLEAALPGFQQLEKNIEAQKVQKNERAKFTFKTKTALKQVAVKLILDQSLDNQRKALVTDIVKASVASSFGAAGTVESVELDLTNAGVPPMQRIGDWFSSYLDQRGGSAIDLAYLLGLVLILLVASLTFGRRWLKMRRGLAMNKAPGGVEIKPTTKSTTVSEQVISQMIDAYVQSPLEVRRFLVMLPESDRRAFLASISAPALRTYFEGVVGTTIGSEKEFEKEKISQEKFATLVRDMERYLQIQREQIKHPFGYMETFETEELVAFVSAEPSPVTAVASLSPYLNKDQYAAITEHWSIADKAQLFKLVHTNSGKTEELDSIEMKLRQRYMALRQKGMVQIRNHLQVEREILESDARINEVLTHLDGEKFQLSAEMQKYRVGFSDLTRLDPALIKTVLQAVPNETLAKALVRQPASGEGWGQLVGEIRFKLIDSIRNRHKSLGPQDIAAAQLEVLRVYRALV